MLKRSCYKPLAGAGLAAPLATLATFGATTPRPPSSDPSTAPHSASLHTCLLLWTGASAGFHEYQFALSMPGYRPARYPYRCHYCCYWYSHHHHCHHC